MWRLVTHRKRRFHLGDALHGHFSEYLIEGLSVVLAIWQLAVCPGFYTDASAAAYTWASWGFAGTSFITAILNMHAMHEVHLTNKDCTKEPGLGMGMASYRREYVETLLYLVGAISFGVASVLFSPQYDDTRHLKDGTYLYLTGSICLLFASYINSIGLAGGEAPGMSLNMAAAMLALSLLGSACFCVGSWLYFPQFSDGTCSVGPTWNAVDRGTDLYMCGCTCFTVVSILAFIKMHLARVRSVEAEDEVVVKEDKQPEVILNKLKEDEQPELVLDGVGVETTTRDKQAQKI